MYLTGPVLGICCITIQWAGAGWRKGYQLVRLLCGLKKKGYSPTCSKDTYVYDSLLHFLVLINLFFLEFIPLGCDEGETSGGMLHQKVSIC